MKTVWIALLVAFLGAAIFLNLKSPSKPPAEESANSPQRAVPRQSEPNFQSVQSERALERRLPKHAAKPDWQALIGINDVAARHEALRQLAIELANTDRQHAAEIASLIFSNKGHLDGDAYAFAMAALSKIVSTDPSAAADWIQALPGQLKLAASTVVAREWAKTDFAGVTEWANRTLDQNLRTSIITAVGGQVEAGDEKIAAEWAQSLSKAEDAPQHSQMIARIWGKVDAHSTFQWVSKLEEGPQRDGAFISLAEALAEKEPRLAGEWVEKFPAGEFRDQAVLSTAQKWSNTDPQAAIGWMTELNEQRLLDSAAPGIVNQWMKKDQATATAWVRNSNLPEHLRNYVLQLNGIPPPEIAK